MDPAPRAFKRNTRAAFGESQNRAASNRKSLDRLSRRNSRLARELEHVERRQRDDLVVTTKPASVAEIRKLAVTIHRR
jgi:hypothetical protein